MSQFSSAARVSRAVVCASLGCAPLLLSSVTANAASPTGPAVVGTAVPQIVYHGKQLLPFLQAMQTGRVDIAGIGDSNQISAGDYGHDHGIQKAWSDRVGLYGTGVLPINGTGGIQVMGYEYAGGMGAIGSPYSAMPAALQPYVIGDVDGFPGQNAVYLPAGQSIPSNRTNIMMAMSSNIPWGAQSAMRYTATYATIAGSSGGSWSPSARIAATGDIIASQTYSTAGPVTGLTQATLNIPADPSRAGKSIWIEPTKLYEKDVTGPFFASYQRLDVPAITHGVAYSTLLYQGGKTTRDAAMSALAASDSSLIEWLRESTRLQDGGKTGHRLMVQIIQGANDLNWNHTELSVGPNPAPTNTPAGYKDNLNALIGRLRQVWTDAGYDPAKLNFVLGAYHPQDGRRADFAAFEEAAMSVADASSNITVLRGTKMVSGLTFSANNWYRTYEANGPQDIAHLSQAGYEGLGRLNVNQMLSLVEDGGERSDVSSLAFTLTGDPTTLRPGDLSLVNLTTGQSLDPADFSVDYDTATHLATWTFPGLEGNVLSLGNYQLSLSIDGSTPLTQNFTAVPEPTAIALLTLGGGLMLRRRRGAI